MPPLATPVRKVGAPLAVIIALGTIAALILTLLTAVNPGGTALGFTFATTATVLVLLCYQWLDRWEPEPPRLLVLAFLWGASVAVILSIVLEHILEASISAGLEPLPTGEPQPSFATMAIGAPVVEEAAKGLFLVLMMTGRRRIELNTLTDCLVYAGFTAAGFAWIENIFYIANGESVAGSLAVAALRLVLGPFAHPLFTTMTAIGVYFALQQRNTAAKVFCVLLGYAGAVIMHGLWNGSAMFGAKAYLTVYVLWMMPIFGLAIALAVASRRRERRIIESHLPGLVSGGLISPGEATWLRSLQTRRMAVETTLRYSGRPAASAVKRFTGQVVNLAYVRDRIDRGFGDERVLALQSEEAHRLLVTRAAAGPALHQLNWMVYPVGRG